VAADMTDDPRGAAGLTGRHAVVTGASRGIGAACAAEMARLGARVTLMARSVEECERNAAGARDSGAEAQAIHCDVTRQGDVEAAFGRAVESFGRVDILVNNAGAALSLKAQEMTRDVWDGMIALNLTSIYDCTAQVLGGMLSARWGRIVNMSSTAGLRGYKTMTAYCAAKHGVIGYTRALALELAKHGVTVNAVCPGYTDTALVDDAVANLSRVFGKTADEARAMLLKTIPRGEFTQPSEVASAVGWLCLPGSGAVTGVALPVTGGEL
jgi:3-hydroxybutyrate dehydrogenase